ncbi:hypothetical protein SAMN06295879_0305 [Agreia bicolorata]|uniref:Uncharacterized protein n=1 Tax=Agreia bicolorata TaxID=110935 RepID=A0A1T4WVK2_9MICO|nr:hypothetical protein SAMN06295879_0305 [Agreia bicolorata]
MFIDAPPNCGGQFPISYAASMNKSLFGGAYSSLADEIASRGMAFHAVRIE